MAIAPDRPPARPLLWTVLLLTVAGLALRGVGLNQQLWHDEIATLVDNVRLPFAELVSSYPSENQHTLYSILAKGSVAAFGEAAWAVRLPAMLLGVAAIPGLYFVGRGLVGRAAALVAAALLTVSYHHIWFSQNARGYTGLLLATLLATGLFVGGLERPAWRTWIAYAGVVALGMYLHLTTVFVAAGHGLIVFGWGVKNRVSGQSLRSLALPAAGLLLAGLFTLILYAPMLDALVGLFSKEGRYIESEWTRLDWAAAETFANLQSGFGLAGLIALGVLSLLGTARLLYEKPLVVVSLWLPIVLCVTALVVTRHNIWPRFLFFGFGLALLVVGRGAVVLADVTARLFSEPLRERVRFALLSVLTVAAVAVSVRGLGPIYTVPKQDYLGAWEFVNDHRSPDEVVATAGMAAYSYERYYRTQWLEVKDERQLDELLAAGRPVWLVYSFPTHLRTRLPRLAERIERDFELRQSFPATVPGGQGRVFVTRSKPSASPPQQASRGPA